MISKPVAPARWAISACSQASSTLSQQIPEITGTRPARLIRDDARDFGALGGGQRENLAGVPIGDKAADSLDGGKAGGEAAQLGFVNFVVFVVGQLQGGQDPAEWLDQGRGLPHGFLSVLGGDRAQPRRGERGPRPSAIPWFDSAPSFRERREGPFHFTANAHFAGFFVQRNVGPCEQRAGGHPAA